MRQWNGPTFPSRFARSNRASEAVNALHTLHSTKMSGPEAHSLFLEQILQESGCFQVSDESDDGILPFDL